MLMVTRFWRVILPQCLCKVSQLKVLEQIRLTIKLGELECKPKVVDRSFFVTLHLALIRNVQCMLALQEVFGLGMATKPSIRCMAVAEFIYTQAWQVSLPMSEIPL